MPSKPFLPDNANKALVRRFLEQVINRNDTRLLPQLVATDHVRHAPEGDVHGPEGVRIELADYRAAFPDLRLVLEDLIAEGDRVVSRFVLRGTHASPLLGVAPCGLAVAVAGIGIDRIVDGRLAESWVSLDTLGLLRRVGRR